MYSTCRHAPTAVRKKYSRTQEILSPTLGQSILSTGLEDFQSSSNARADGVVPCWSSYRGDRISECEPGVSTVVSPIMKEKRPPLHREAAQKKGLQTHRRFLPWQMTFQFLSMKSHISDIRKCTHSATKTHRPHVHTPQHTHTPPHGSAYWHCKFNASRVE